MHETMLLIATLLCLAGCQAGPATSSSGPPILTVLVESEGEDKLAATTGVGEVQTGCPDADVLSPLVEVWEQQNAESWLPNTAAVVSVYDEDASAPFKLTVIGSDPDGMLRLRSAFLEAIGALPIVPPRINVSDVSPPAVTTQLVERTAGDVVRNVGQSTPENFKTAMEVKFTVDSLGPSNQVLFVAEDSLGESSSFVVRFVPDRLSDVNYLGRFATIILAG